MLDASEKFKAALERHKLGMRAEFVPYSKSRNAHPRDGNPKPWRSLNWRVTLTRDGRDLLTTDYSAGEAHAPYYKRHALACGRMTVFERSMCDAELETGFAVRETHEHTPILNRKAPILPDLSDVWASIVNDSRGVLDAGSFEEWASAYGYDTDSRKAEATYKACRDHALTLVASIGAGGILDHLSELAGEL